MMKIILVTSQFPPDSIGGVEGDAQYMTQNFCEFGHEVFLLTGRLTEDPEQHGKVVKESYESHTIFRILVHLEYRNLLHEWSIRDQPIQGIINKIFKDIKPDFVHILQMGILTFAPLLSAIELNIPLALSVLNYELFCHRTSLIMGDGSLCDGSAAFHKCLDCNRHKSRKSNALFRLMDTKEQSWKKAVSISNSFPLKRIGLMELGQSFLERFEINQIIMDKAVPLITPSAWVKKLLIENRYSESKIHIIEHGLKDKDKLTEKKYDRNNNTLTFGYLGRIHSTKGLDVLIRAYRNIRSDRNTALEIYGPADRFEKDYYDSLIELASGAEDIRFHGKYSSQDLNQILSKIDVLVVPSQWYEVFGMVVLEAAAKKIPVIASDIGGLAGNVRNYQAGWLFDPFDQRALEEILISCCDDKAFVEEKQKSILPPMSARQESIKLLDLYQLLIHQKG